MPGQFFSPEGDLEEYFITNHWLIDQYIGDQLWLWGVWSGGFGNVNRSIPSQQQNSYTNWKQISVADFGVVAIKTDGTLWSFGSNSNGPLGINDTLTRSTPVQEFTSSTNWRSVSTGSFFTAAIKTDGTLWCWGNNQQGQLGTNDTINRLTPVQEFTSSTNWKQVSCGWFFWQATKTDGTIWGCGDGYGNTLGTNVNIIRSTPAQEFSSSTNWKSVSCGGGGGSYNAIALGLKYDNTLWYWGAGRGIPSSGLFVGSTATPVREFTSSSNWKIIACGNNHGAAIKTDGCMYQWGNAANGELGIGTNSSYNTMRQEVTYSTNWKSVSAGDGVLAIKTDGTLWGSRGAFALGAPSSTVMWQEYTSATNWKQSANAGLQSLFAAIKTGIEMDTGNLT